MIKSSRRVRRWALAAGLLVGLPGLAGAQVLDLEGQPVDPLAGDAAATVLLFTETDCPIANRYAPTIRRLAGEFERQGLEFWLVYPYAQITPDAIREHVAAYDLPGRAVRDPQHVLVKRAGVTMTPEAAVFLRDGSLAYRGRIDDWYVSFGRARPAPTTHDLRNALEAVVAGTPVPPATGHAVGCYIPELP